MSPLNAKKVFCIGFNKTGTSSLHALFEKVGLNSIHSAAWPHMTYNKIRPNYFAYDAYSDGEQADFINLDRNFPNAVFILNTRDDLAWLASRIKHVNRSGTSPGTAIYYLESKEYRKMAKEYFTDMEMSTTKWLMEKRLYEKQVRIYFSDRTDFLEVDVTSEDHWERKVVDFLIYNDFSLQNSDAEIFQKKVNKRDIQKMENEEEIREQIGAALDALNAKNIISH